MTFICLKKNYTVLHYTFLLNFDYIHVIIVMKILLLLPPSEAHAVVFCRAPIVSRS